MGQGLVASGFGGRVWWLWVKWSGRLGFESLQKLKGILSRVVLALALLHSSLETWKSFP